MTATLSGGPRIRRLSEDDEGHRTYFVVYRVTTDDADDGPQIVRACPGLPTVGSYWNIGNDNDPWAYCTRYKEIEPAGTDRVSDEPAKYWNVELKFSTLPLSRCQDTEIDDPLLEPDRVSGSFVKFTKEATKDRHGNLIITPSFERIRGPQVEFDDGRHSVRVQQNVADLELDLLAELTKRGGVLNDAPLWGMPVRCVKFSGYTWERLRYGVCDFYYVRVLDFEVDFNGFDRSIPYEGSKALAGEWEDLDTGTGATDVDWHYQPYDWADSTNPEHFYRFCDPLGNPCRVLLTDGGLPANVELDTGTAVSGEPGELDLEYYDEDNLLQLGIPTSF